MLSTQDKFRSGADVGHWSDYRLWQLVKIANSKATRSRRPYAVASLKA